MKTEKRIVKRPGAYSCMQPLHPLNSLSTSVYRRLRSYMHAFLVYYNNCIVILNHSFAIRRKTLDNDECQVWAAYVY